MIETPPGPPDRPAPGGLSWLRDAWWKHHGWLVPLLVGLLPLLWLARDGSAYIYGQDSQSFARPFAFSHDPLIPYSYDFSQSYPIPFYVTGFFPAAAVYLVDGLTGSPTVTEHLVLFAFAAVGALGMWDLLRLAGRRWFGPSAGGPVRRGIAVAFYLVNPFALSVAWWHIEGWTENYVFLPWLLSALLLVYWEGRLSLARGTVVVLLSLLLADGVGGAFAIPIGYLFLVVILALLAHAVRDRARRSALPRALLTLGALGVAMLAWSSIPFALTPNPGYSSNTYVNAQNLDTMFLSQSQFTGGENTIRMLGFSWIYAAPSAYPWSGWLVTLAVAGTLAAVAYVTAVVWVRRYPGFGLLWAGSAVLLALSFGANPPFGAIDRWLLDRHGPFLLLVDPYYLILEPWVVTVCVAVFVWLASTPRDAMAEVRRFGRWLRVRLGSRAIEARTALPWTGRPAYDPAVITTAILGLGVVLVLASVAPVAAFGEYSTTGPNVDEFPLPSGLAALSTYFAQGYQGAQYEVLALPMTSAAGVPWLVPGGSFLDTSSLLSTYIPYPVLQADNGFLPAALMDWFGSSPATNYTEVLTALHIKAVVVNPYVDRQAPQVRTSADGLAVNWTHVQTVLNASLGEPQMVGGFGVYPVPSAGPFLWVETNLTTVQTPTLPDYLALLANVSSGDPLGRYLATALWSPSPASADRLGVTPLTGPDSVVDVPTGGSARALLENGSSLAIPSLAAVSEGVTEGTNGSSGGAVTVTTPILASLGNASSYATTLVPRPGGLTGPPGANGSLEYLEQFPSQLLVETDLTLSLLPGANWAQVDLAGRNVTLQIQLYDVTGSSEGNLGLSAMNSTGVPFAWSNTAVPFGAGPVTFDLTMRNSPAALQVALAGTGGAGVTDATIFYQGASELGLDAGYNYSAFPGDSASDGPLNVSFSTVNAGVTLTGFSVYQNSPVVGIATFSGVNRSTALPARISQAYDGSWSITPSSTGTGVPDGSQSYVVLDLPQFSAWAVTGGPSPASTVAVSNLSNAFLLPGALSPGTALTVSFASPQFAGLVLAWAELAAGAVILAVLAVRRWRL
jgi:hypothetical protein